jgi:hypothetical protein
MSCPNELRYSLLLNVVVTVALDCMSYIHSTTLRWALFHEGRLENNSNLRLFSSSRLHIPNKRYMNVISGLSLALTYRGVASLMKDFDIIGEWRRGNGK